MKNRKENKTGFTLIELMIVIAIIGILAAMALPNFKRSRDLARMTKCHEFSSILSRTAELYYIEKRAYPEDVNLLGPYMGAGGKMPQCPGKGVYNWVPGSKEGAEGARVLCTLHGCASSTWGG